MNPKLDRILLLGGALIMIVAALAYTEAQLLVAILATVAFVYMALKYDSLKEKTQATPAKK